MLQTCDDNGDIQSLSYRCADLNKLLPDMMGVSPAVLESVIFVHQEESCWPLAEDKVLKQKFDDIFAATHYTKALDSLKAYKLEKGKEIRALAAELETAETKLSTGAPHDGTRAEACPPHARRDVLQRAGGALHSAASSDLLPECCTAAFGQDGR